MASKGVGHESWGTSSQPAEATRQALRATSLPFESTPACCLSLSAPASHSPLAASFIQLPLTALPLIFCLSLLQMVCRPLGVSQAVNGLLMGCPSAAYPNESNAQYQQSHLTRTTHAVCVNVRKRVCECDKQTAAGNK